MTTINERQVGLKTGGNFTLLKDYMDKVGVARQPFNETQTLTGLTASDGDVIVDTLIPANAQIADNLKMSDGAYDTAAKEGGIVTQAGTETTGFIAAGTFVHDMVTVTDDYGNVLNMVQVRYEASHDPVTDTDGREVMGLLVRPFATADDTALGEAASENLEICFVVADGAGAYAKAAGGVTGAIEFNINRAFGERFKAKISLDGGNAVDVDVIADLETVHYTDLLVTTAFAVDEVITIATGAGSVAGVSTSGGDVTPVTLNATGALFVADNTCVMTLNGIKGTKEAAVAGAKDFAWESATTFSNHSILDIGDVVGIERKY